MQALLLAALLTSPSGAANIKTVPTEIVVPLNTALPRENVAAPLLPAGLTDPALREIPRLAAPIETLGPRPELDAARLPVTAAADPAGRRGALLETAPRLETEERREAETGEKTEGAKETAEELVRRLLKKGRSERTELDAAFDGQAALAAVGLEAPVQGEVRKTRHGEYTLASTEVSERNGVTVLLERWEGPGGGLWVEHKRGPRSWQWKEYRGKHKPGPGMPLPAAAYAEFDLTDQDRLWGHVVTQPDDGPASVMINAKQAFREAEAYFRDRLSGVKGSWVYGTNLALFNRLTKQGLSPQEAALGTWTGQRAAELGYTKVVFSGEGLKELQAKKPGEYEKMSALFLKP